MTSGGGDWSLGRRKRISPRLIANKAPSYEFPPGEAPIAPACAQIATVPRREREKGQRTDVAERMGRLCYTREQKRESRFVIALCANKLLR